MNTPNNFEYDVCVVGTGRVGLPLALSLIEVGLNVIGLDTDENLRNQVNEGVMPFKEPHYDGLIERRSLKIFGEPTVVSKSRDIIITVGTPLHTHIETDLTQIRSVLESIVGHLSSGQLNKA